MGAHIVHVSRLVLESHAKQRGQGSSESAGEWAHARGSREARLEAREYVLPPSCVSVSCEFRYEPPSRSQVQMPLHSPWIAMVPPCVLSEAPDLGSLCTRATRAPSFQQWKGICSHTSVSSESERLAV